MEKIFIVSEFIGAKQNSTGYYWSSIICGLAGKYNNVAVICPNLPQNVIDGDQVKIHYLRSVSMNKNKLISRLLGQIIYALRFFSLLLSKPQKDDVICSGTNPALLLMLMPFVKKIKKVKWLLLVHDVFPENLVPAGLVDPNSMLFKWAKMYFDWVYSSADTLVVIGRDMQILLNDKTATTNKTAYISNWVDPLDVVPVERADALFLKELGWGEDKVVFQFFGNIGRVQGVDNLLAAINLVTNPRAAFIFIGAGAMVSTLKAYLVENPHLPVAYLGELSLDKKNLGLAACDIAIVTLAQGMLGLGVPSKAYFSMAADKPILMVSEVGSEISQVISEEKIGWCCESNNPDKLAKLIDDICSLDELTSVRPRQVFMNRFTEEIALNKFFDCVQKLLLVSGEVKPNE